MSEEVYEALAKASSGFVESPAGCGKTEAIVRAVGDYCEDRQLVLTHTHAGVDALRRRFRKLEVPTSRYHVDTIAGWSWGWVRQYPENAGYEGSTEFPEWSDVYPAMSRLLQKGFVSRGVLNSYAGAIVDEYQDCTVSMHELIVGLKNLLPCRVLGDDLQGIFNFREEKLVSWSDVRKDFDEPPLGTLETPHRWINAGNETLGRWLLERRDIFRQGCEPDYLNSPVDVVSVTEYKYLQKELYGLNDKKKGRICVIGPKAWSDTSILTALARVGYRILEPQDLKTLHKFILILSEEPLEKKSEAVRDFLSKTHGGLSSSEKEFIKKFLKGRPQRPRLPNRKKLCEIHGEKPFFQRLLAVLEYVGRTKTVLCKLRESVSALKCVLEEHMESGTALESLYADEIAKRKHGSRDKAGRCVGSTLLVKGLEFDHAVIVRHIDWQKNWGTHRDLYVALTRGCKSVTLIETAY